MEVPKQVLKGKLAALNATQASIETTAKYILFYSDDAEAIVQVWYEEFARSPTDRKLSLLYVANHVMQLGKKKAKDWVAEFSKVLEKSFKSFAQKADEKSKGSAERMAKIWADRGIMSTSLSRQLCAMLKSTDTAAVANSKGKEPAPPSSMASSNLKKLQASGKLPDVLLEVSKAEQSALFTINKAKLIKASVPTDGTYAEVASAKDVYTNCVKAIHVEVTARKTALAELKTMISRQESAISKSEEQGRTFEALKQSVEGRLHILQQQKQQQEAEAAASAAAAAAAQAAVQTPAAAASTSGAGSMPQAPWPGSIMPTSQPSGMIPVPMAGHQMPGQAMGMMGMSVAGPGGDGMLGMMPGMMPPGGPSMMMMPQVSAAPAPGSSSTMPSPYPMDQQQQSGNGGHYQFHPEGSFMGQEDQQQQVSSSGGGDFQMTDDLAAQLAAHLSNQDALLSLAKSIAEFMPQDGLLDLSGVSGGGNGDDVQQQLHQQPGHESTSSALSGISHSQAASGAYGTDLGFNGTGNSFQFQGMGGGANMFQPMDAVGRTDGEGSPVAPGMDEYDPDDPV